MFVIAHHNIREPAQFWAAAPQVLSAIPAHIKLHSVFPSKDLETGFCVWEAPDASEVQQLVDRILGTMSKNICYEVNEEVAIGLPQKLLEEMHA